MSIPTTGILFNSTNPAAPAGNQNVIPQTDGATPLQSVTFYLKPATVDLVGGVKPDGVTIAIDADGTISAALGGASAIITAIQQQAYVFGLDAGTTNAYVITQTPAPTIVQGSLAVVLALAANTGTATLNVNGSVGPLLKQGSVPLIGGEIAAGQIFLAIYDGANWQLVGGGLVSSTATGGSGSTVIPTGAINGSNVTFTLPTVSTGIKPDGELYLNGIFQNPLTTTPDYTMSMVGTTPTITMANAPQAGTTPDVLIWVYASGSVGPAGPQGPSGVSAMGTWYQEIPVGSKNGTNIDFYLSRVPTDGYIIYVVNGYTQDPGTDFTISSNHIVNAVPLKSTDKVRVWYFSGATATTPAGSGGGTGGGGTVSGGSTVVTVWAAYPYGGGGTGGYAVLQYSADGGTTWTTFATGGSSPMVFPSTATWAKAQFSPTVTLPTDLSQFQVRMLIGWGGGYTSGQPDQFQLYDISLPVTYANGTTGVVKPTAWSVVDHSNGSATNGQYCYDADSNPPVTCGVVARPFFNSLSDSDYLVLTGWS